MFLLKTKTFFILGFLFLVLAGCKSKKQSVLLKKYSVKQLQQDATLYKDVVLAMHPVIGLYESQDYYKKRFEEFVTSIKDSLTEKEFRYRLKLLTDELHCGHTEVIASKRTYKEMGRLKQNFSPYIFLPVQNRVYLLANVNKKQDSVLKRGVEITKINGIAVDSMVRYCKRFVTADGYIQSSKEHYVQLGFNAYYLSLFGRPDTFEVEFKKDSVLRSNRYAAIKPKSIPPIPLRINDDSLFVRYKKAAMRYRYIDTSKKTMLLKLDRFSHRKVAKAYRKIFKSLKNHHTENLIIDLRNNGGGSLANSYRLLSYLLNEVQPQTLTTKIKEYPYKKYTHGNLAFKFTKWVYCLIGEKKIVEGNEHFIYRIKPNKKYHFNGKVLVLQNGGSFSASCLVAAYLKYQERAAFIGEESGGTLEGCNAGVTPYYTLPNTKLRVRVPAFRIVHDVSPATTGHGILPDYQISYTIKDILSRQDLELIKAQELLNK